MALLMLPRVVLTHLKAGFRAALRPDPVMIGWWTQPALPRRQPARISIVRRGMARALRVLVRRRHRPRPLRESQAGRQARRNPTNHNLRFAPVIHPTLQTGLEALIVAGRAWL